MSARSQRHDRLLIHNAARGRLRIVTSPSERRPRPGTRVACYALLTGRNLARRERMRHLASAISVVAGLTIAAAASASAAVVGPVQVSGPTPYAACASRDAEQTGRNFLNGEEEPSLAVNPTNPANMIGQFHQDRWSNGGAHGIGGAFTTDGGA